MADRLAIVGVPSSAGAYSPGQEKAPAALRAAGLIAALQARGITVDDLGDTPAFRWRADHDNPRAMNAIVVEQMARSVAKHVTSALAAGEAVLVLGGDCTIELGTVAGALASTKSVGLIYIDLDTDLNTPASTGDGALDWMGIAHLLGIEGTVPSLIDLGAGAPMLSPEQVLFFAFGNTTDFERSVIDTRSIQGVPLEAVVANPSGAAQGVIDGWARQFDRLLVHLDVDVLDFLDFPLAENTRHNIGLRFDQLILALQTILAAPNWAALTITEVNPDHGASDGSNLRTFVEALADTLAQSQRLTDYKTST